MTATGQAEYLKTDKSGAWAVASGAAIWGLFWIPLRFLNESGVTGLWPVALVLAAALLPALIVCRLTKELQHWRNLDCWLVGFALGLATVLYFIGILYSDVIRVIFLFYLLPLWTTLSARVLYGEPIRRAQVLVIAAALTGVWLLLGGGTALPLPQNGGDWCAIFAGVSWGVSLSLLRGRELTPPFFTTSASLAAGLLMAIVGAFVMQLINPEFTISLADSGAHSWLRVLPLALAFGAVILYPAMLGQIWGARRIPAPTAALLTMTEIIVATVSAGLLIGTDLPPISLFGGALIIIAVCIDLSIQRQEIQRPVA